HSCPGAVVRFPDEVDGDAPLPDPEHLEVRQVLLQGLLELAVALGFLFFPMLGQLLRQLVEELLDGLLFDGSVGVVSAVTQDVLGADRTAAARPAEYLERSVGLTRVE